MRNIVSASLLLALSSYAKAQFGGGNPYSGGNNPYSGGNDGPFSGGGFGSFFGSTSKAVTAHAILATVAVGLLFPIGGILIRLASFRGVWLAHGLFQIFAYIVFTAAFAIGVWMYTHIPSELPNGIRIANQAHPIIGIIVFGLLFLQPWLGLIHHVAFKKYSRRVFWSYAHIWIGRFVITLGIINGGLGLQLSQRIGQFAASQGSIIAYGVVAGVMWLLYVLSAIYGEAKRRRTQYEAKRAATSHKRERRYSSRSDRREGVRYA